MFFGSTSKKTALKAESDHILKQMSNQREEIKKRLHQMTEVNKQLDTAVKETQILSLEVIEKLRKELKIAKKSITSICSKLKEGVILVDHAGKIIQLNKAGEKLFEIANDSVVDKDFSEVVAWLEPTDEETETKIDLDPRFFSHLSNKLISKLKKLNTKTNSYSFCNECIQKELPICFDFDSEKIINAFVSSMAKPIKVSFSFSILDNDPQTLDDVIYIFIFRKTSPESTQRRYYEQDSGIFK